MYKLSLLLTTILFLLHESLIQRGYALILIQNGFYFDSHKKTFIPGDIHINNGIISSIVLRQSHDSNFDNSSAYSDNTYDYLHDGSETINAENMLIIPGFIDLHTHGAAGRDFIISRGKDLCELFDYYNQHGITTVFPTTITAPLDLMLDTVSSIKAYARKSPLPVNIGGIHIEGPYINKANKGAHDERFIRPPYKDEIDAILSAAGGLPLYFTIAPEIDGALDMITYIKSMGANVSIGHSSASGEITREALKRGAVSFTHLFNGMGPFHHRDEGTIAAALDTNAFVEIICDGIHLSPYTIRLVNKVKSPEQIILVTDSILTAGLPDGEYFFNETLYKVDKGISKVGASLAGSSLNMLDALKNFMEFTGTPLNEALATVTINPAEAAGISHITGSIEEGKRADLMIIKPDLTLKAIICNGRLTGNTTVE